MTRILLTGMSGVGKSAVLQRLASDGILCVDLDDGWMYDAGGEPMINLPVVHRFIQAHPNESIVFAGCAMNQRKLEVDCTVLLTASPKLMKARIEKRENPFGKDEHTWQKILADKAQFEPVLRASSDVVIDTEQLLEQTAAKIREMLADGYSGRNLNIEKLPK
jgi:dephospho-CoA kinase